MKRNHAPEAIDESRLLLASFLPYQMNVLARRMSEELAALYGSRFGITIPEWRVLAHLAEEEHVSIREIHRKVAMDKVKVTRAAQRLEKAGLIRKLVQPADRRLVELSLTIQGRDVFRQIVPLALSYERRVLATVAKHELVAFREVLNHLLQNTR